MRLRASLIAGLLALLGTAVPAVAAPAPPAAACAAQRRWQSLPPTPRLPSPERQGYVAHQGARLWYGEYGRRHGGTPVLLLHGGLASSAYFGRLIPALVASGHWVIAMDSRGHGRSTAPDQPYSYRAMAGDVVAVLDRLEVAKADVVGWSDGGTIGYQLALDAPHRIRRLLAFGANATLAGLKPDYAVAPTFAAYIERSAAEYRQIAPHPATYPVFLDDISKMWGTDPFESIDRLRSVRVPVTVMIGQYDEAMTVAHATAIAMAIPDANLVTLPDVSHFAVLQCPAQFNQAVLAFLRWR